MSEKPERHQFRVTDAEAGERLDRYLAQQLPHMSRSRVKTLIKEGHARLAGQTIEEPNSRVKSGDEMATYEMAFVKGQPFPTGFAFVSRDCKDKILFVGWRHSFRRIIGANIPGCSRTDLEEAFHVDLSKMLLDEVEEDTIPVGLTHKTHEALEV